MPWCGRLAPHQHQASPRPAATAALLHHQQGHHVQASRRRPGQGVRRDHHHLPARSAARARLALLLLPSALLVEHCHQLISTSLVMSLACLCRHCLPDVPATLPAGLVGTMPSHWMHGAPVASGSASPVLFLKVAPANVCRHGSRAVQLGCTSPWLCPSRTHASNHMMASMYAI